MPGSREAGEHDQVHQRDAAVGKPITTAQEAVTKLAVERAGGHLARIRRGARALFVVVPNPREDG